MESIEKQILQFEKELCKSAVRKSSDRISELLDVDFIEFCSSGAEYHYKTGDVFQEADIEIELDWEIIDFKIKQIDDDCILAMYKLVKHSEKDLNKKYSMRSSIWKYTDGKLKMVFHQGTNKQKI